MTYTVLHNDGTYEQFVSVDNAIKSAYMESVVDELRLSEMKRDLRDFKRVWIGTVQIIPCE